MKMYWLELQAIGAPFLCVKSSPPLDAEDAGILLQPDLICHDTVKANAVSSWSPPTWDYGV